jgi:hypothetical protein
MEMAADSRWRDRVATMITPKASSGSSRAGAVTTRLMGSGVAGCMASLASFFPQRRIHVRIDRIAAPVDHQDGGQADGHFGGGNRQDKNDDGLPFHLLPVQGRAHKATAAALSMISMPSSIMIRLRRARVQNIPRVNSSADSSRI